MMPAESECGKKHHDLRKMPKNRRFFAKCVSHRQAAPLANLLVFYASAIVIDEPLRIFDSPGREAGDRMPNRAEFSFDPRPPGLGY
ncbi:MAG TPA: hypothetical protein VLI90_10270 [Tepidisphaeraceae bacterium]|nr:hypothetical protein [Tepidisphaeraceae bacterium]